MVPASDEIVTSWMPLMFPARVSTPHAAGAAHPAQWGGQTVYPRTQAAPISRPVVLFGNGGEAAGPIPFTVDPDDPLVQPCAGSAPLALTRRFCAQP